MENNDNSVKQQTKNVDAYITSLFGCQMKSSSNLMSIFSTCQTCVFKFMQYSSLRNPTLHCSDMQCILLPYQKCRYRSHQRAILTKWDSQKETPPHIIGIHYSSPDQKLL